MAYNRLTPDAKQQVAQLAPELKTLADAIFWEAQTQGCFHDTTCDMLERGDLKPYANTQIDEVLTAMGSYWDYTDTFGVRTED